MDYMTLKEASIKWGVSPRQINYYCTDGRILGAENRLSLADSQRCQETIR